MNVEIISSSFEGEAGFGETLELKLELSSISKFILNSDNPQFIIEKIREQSKYKKSKEDKR